MQGEDVSHPGWQVLGGGCELSHPQVWQAQDLLLASQAQGASSTLQQGGGPPRATSKH